MTYLIVGEDEQYIKEDVNPEELKLAAKGAIKIFQIDTGEHLNPSNKIIINVYDPDLDHFETELPKRYE